MASEVSVTIYENKFLLFKGQWARHRSDDEFINDDSDPDYMEESKGRKRKGGGMKGRGGWFMAKKTKGRQRGKKKKYKII